METKILIFYCQNYDKKKYHSARLIKKKCL